MDPIDTLISGSIHSEIDINKNPYLTLETIILRLYQKIFQRTRVYPSFNEKTILFEQWHNDILAAYETLRSSLSHDERACVERILSKDCPHPSELIKFACCWYKYNATTACKWFAVDGLLGSHPKLYAQDAFSPHLAKHNHAVRTLYTYYSNPEQIKEIVEQAFLRNEDEPCPRALEADMERCVALYAGMVGEADMKLVSAERKSKLQQPPHKRKKVSAT